MYVVAPLSCEVHPHLFHHLHMLIRVAVRIGTGGDAPHMGEELQHTWVPNSSEGTRKLTRLTSKYILRGKKKKAKIIIRQLKLSLFLESRRCADSSYDQRAQGWQASASPKIQLTDGFAK